MNKKNLIMVVEDEILLNEVIVKKLKLSGFETASFFNGKKAISHLESSKVLPDLIWLDYYLGDMTGIDLVNIMKKNSKLSKIPVIIVSNTATDDKIKTLLSLGINKYFLKAENRLEDIISELKIILQKND